MPELKSTIMVSSYPPFFLSHNHKKTRQCLQCKKEMDSTLSKRATYCKKCAKQRNAYKKRKKKIHGGIKT